ncbi:Tumor suppressor p53-binding protein 1, partial [Ophiophagus hannah]
MSSHVPGIMQPHKETPKSPVSACLLLERTPPVKNPHPWPLEEVESVSSTQEDMFGQNSSTAPGRLEEASSPPSTPADPLCVLQLSGQGPLSNCASGLARTTSDVLQPVPFILPRSPTEQEAGGKQESPPLETVGTFQGSVPVSQDAFVLPSQPEFSHDTFLPTPSLEEGCKIGAEKEGSSEGSEAPEAATSASSAEASLAEPREDDCVLALSASQGSQGTTAEEGKTTDDAASCALEEKLCLPDGCSKQEADEETSLGDTCSDLGHEGSVPSKASLLLEGEAVPETPCEKPEVTLLDEGLSLRLTISQAVEQAECSAAFPPNDPHVTGKSGKLEQGPLDNPSKAGLEVQSLSQRVHPGMMLKQTGSEPQPEQGSRQFQRRADSFPGEILHAHVPPEPPFCILLAKERDALTPPLGGQHKKGPRHSTPIVAGSNPEHPAIGTEGRDGVLEGAGSAGIAAMEESPQGSSVVACEEEGGLSLHRNLVTPMMEESDEPLPFSLE